MPAGEGSRSVCNYDSKLWRSRVRGSPGASVLLHHDCCGCLETKQNPPRLAVSVASIFRRNGGDHWAQAPFIFGSNVKQDLITKWQPPPGLSLLCGPPAPWKHVVFFCFFYTWLRHRSSWGSHECRSILSPRGTSGVSWSLLQGGGRGERLHSVYIIKATYRESPSDTEPAPIQLLPSAVFF